MDKEIGNTYMLIKDNGNHSYMLTKGCIYKLVEYNPNEPCPYKVTSDHGDNVHYSITENTFKNDIRKANYSDAITIKFGIGE